MKSSEPLRLSASAAKAYLECPYKFARDYVDRLPPDEREPVSSFAFGNAVHAALADFTRRGGKDGQTQDELISHLVRHWDGTVYPDSNAELYYFHIARDLLERFYAHPYPADVVRELGIERYLSWRAPRLGLLITGKLDRACLVPSGMVEIVDYKTGGRKLEPGAMREDLQALFYRTLSADHYPRSEERGIRVTFYYLTSGEAVSVDYDREDFMTRWPSVLRLADRIRAAIELFESGLALPKAFPLSRSIGCRRCPMRRHCDALEDGRAPAPDGDQR